MVLPYLGGWEQWIFGNIGTEFLNHQRKHLLLKMDQAWLVLGEWLDAGELHDSDRDIDFVQSITT
jgi:hypothetical protein